MHVVKYSSLFKLNLLGCPGTVEEISFLTCLRNNSKADEPFVGFQVDLCLHAETSEGISWLSFLKYHLHLNFLAKTLDFSLLINDGEREKPKLLLRILITVLNNTLLMHLMKYCQDLLILTMSSK